MSLAWEAYQDGGISPSLTVFETSREGIGGLVPFCAELQRFGPAGALSAWHRAVRPLAGVPWGSVSMAEWLLVSREPGLSSIPGWGHYTRTHGSREDIGVPVTP